MKLEPRYYQKEAFEKFFSDLKKHKGCSPLIVLPTGTGKSFTIALMAKHMASFGLRTLVLAHKKELVEQNRDEMKSYGVDCGHLCAGLGKADVNHVVVSATIQTMWSRFRANPNCAGRFKLVLVDEAHMVNNEDVGIYRKLIAGMQECMPGLGVGGLTATPFRAGQGWLTSGENKIFTHVSYEYNIKKALDDGFLCPVVTPKTHSRYNTSGMKIGASGDYTAQSLKKIADQKNMTSEALVEIDHIMKTCNRKGVILFASTKKHCYEIEDIMSSMGNDFRAITDDTPGPLRSRLISDFKSGKISGLISRDILTVGFNAKHVDLIGFLRKTSSLALWVQALGRGMRISPGKTECMIADFCGNVGYHPPIDNIDFIESVKPKKKRAPKNLDNATKLCPSCKHEVHIFARQCEYCDHSFNSESVAIEVSNTMSQGFIISPDEVSVAGQAKKNRVSNVRYMKHKSKNGRQVLKVQYIFDPFDPKKRVDEYIPLGMRSFSGVDPVEWSQKFFGSNVCDIDQAVELACSGKIKKPESVRVVRVGKYSKVYSYIFRDETELVNPMFQLEHKKATQKSLF